MNGTLNSLSNVSIFPNAIDHEEKQYVPKPTKSSKVRIGWLGGSSHIEDLNILHGLAGRVQSAKKDKFQFVLCGYDLRGSMTVFDERTGKRTQRPITPKESVWYKYEKLFTDDYRIIDGEYKDVTNEHTRGKSLEEDKAELTSENIRNED